MPISFQFHGLPAEEFRRIFDLNDEQLAAEGIRRMTADERPGFPCRVSLEDADVGETVWLVPYVHHDVASPYRASGPIFVRQNVATARPAVNEIPDMFQTRLLSVRAYDPQSLMIAADVVSGSELEECLVRLLSRPEVDYLHIHNARPGCFNCRVTRA